MKMLKIAGKKLMRQNFYKVKFELSDIYIFYMLGQERIL